MLTINGSRIEYILTAVDLKALIMVCPSEEFRRTYYLRKVDFPRFILLQAFVMIPCSVRRIRISP